MSGLNLKPTHAAVKAYYENLHSFGQLHFDNEAQVSDAFAKLLANCGRKLHLTFVPQFPIERAKSRVVVDGALLDTYHLAHGYWEAKDEKDDLDKEVKSKLDRGYPRDNIIFQAPERAILYQAGARIADEDISKPDYLAQIVNQFFTYRAPHIEEWEEAVAEFSDRIPELATAVFKIIEDERRRNPAFVKSFEDFYALCRQAINPNLSPEAVERMLVQHLLTERIFRTIFHNPDFARRNVVAVEIEKVIAALTSRSFNRDEFLSKLDRFYKAIELSAENTTGFSEKQAFLNKVYERFFQGYSPKEADTHGIVYTPQPIVNFMVRSVEEILQKEFGRSLSDKNVHILEPFVGTGNFIVRIMQEIKTTALSYKYEHELHCNEVMLLPYYIASMNIEHAYFDRTSEYKPFPGICLVDTFELAEPEQSSLGFMTEENAQRVKRQKEAPIFVIIGNPPYNVGQVNENDNNKNRKYPAMDHRVSESYSRASKATSLSKLNDVYVKAFRWAEDRLGDTGVISFVTNNSFLEKFAFDGVRLHLAKDFSGIYILDLGGDVRKNPTLSGTTHNVFGIQVGVSINILVKTKERGTQTIHYARVGENWRKEEKYKYLEQNDTRSKVQWQQLHPDAKHNWLTAELSKDFEQLISIGAKDTDGIFASYGLGVSTNRDAWAYNFQKEELAKNVLHSVDFYNGEVRRWLASDRRTPIDEFVRYDDSAISWSRDLKADLKRGRTTDFGNNKLRWSLYRPFTESHLFLDRVFNEEVYSFPKYFPDTNSEFENVVICSPSAGARAAYWCLITRLIPNLALTSIDAAQCFPFYTYDEDGTHRRENITDWALEQFRSHYHDPSITKWDIFHYVYAVLHHPEYRQRYAANLRRELPRIPFIAGTTDHVAADAPVRQAERSSAAAVAVAAGATAKADERRYENLSDEAIDSVLSQTNETQDRGELHYVSQADLRVFRAFVAAGRRLAEIHTNNDPNTRSPEPKSREKSSIGASPKCVLAETRLRSSTTT
jgi:predicted helicase